MKTPLQDGAQSHGANELDLCAADWLQRQTFWNWGVDEQAALDAWLAQSRAHRIAYWRQKAVWDNTERLVALRSPASPRGRRAAAGKPQIFRIAAAAIAIGVLGFAGLLYLQRAKTKETVYATRVGGRQMVALADGSRIELNTDTVLRMRSEARGRFATLEKGEAFFHIKHDAAHPFVVNVADHRVTDLGTEFSIRNTPDRLEVTLIEGRARFESTNKSLSAQTTVLTPGDVVVATMQATTVAKRPEKELKSELGWRHGMLTFYRATLSDAANEFNRYNERKIVVADRAAAAELIDGTFPTNDVDLFGRVAHAVLGLQVKNESREIVISR